MSQEQTTQEAPVQVTEMTDGQAIHLLIQGVKAAQSKGGIYTLNDAALLNKAVEHFDFIFNTEVQAEQPESQEK
jgi:hypothetical protein